MRSSSEKGESPSAMQSETDSSKLSRREFLAGVGGAVALTSVAGVSTQPSAPREAQRYQRGATYGEAKIGRDGVRILAEHERAQQQKGNSISYSKRVDAVKDLGCDPKGNEPIQDKVASAAEDGMQIIFPPGNYLVTNSLNIGIDGTFSLVGKGFKNSTEPPKSGKNSVVFKIDADGPIDFLNVDTLNGGHFGNFVIDQRDPLTHGGVLVRSQGNVRVRDIRTVGAQTQVDGEDNNPGFFSPRADGGDSLIVYERCIARGGGVPGSKNIGGSPGVSIFGRNGERGTIILKDCVVENMADNGIYGARTKATVKILGGLYRNNDVSQVRVNGDATIKGVDVVIDEKNYTGVKTKSNAREKGPGWPATNGLKIETKASISSNTGTPVTDCNIVGKSVVSESTVGALVRVWDSGGAVTLENTRITNNINGTQSIVAEKPGSGKYPAAPEPWTFTMKDSVIQGKQAAKGNPAVDVRGRPRSTVKNSCMKYPDADAGDILGAGVSGVSYGRQCKNGGLSNPEKVGSGGNISSLPAPSVNYGSGAGSGVSDQYRKKTKKKYKRYIMYVFVTVLVVFVLIGGGVLAFISWLIGDG